MNTPKMVKKRCCICGRIADYEYDAKPYKANGICCADCYTTRVIVAKKWQQEKKKRKYV